MSWQDNRYNCISTILGRAREKTDVKGEIFLLFSLRYLANLYSNLRVGDGGADKNILGQGDTGPEHLTQS